MNNTKKVKNNIDIRNARGKIEARQDSVPVERLPTRVEKG